MKLILQIQREGSNWHCVLFENDAIRPLFEKRVLLDKRDKVTIKGSQYPLARLVQAYSLHEKGDLALAFDSRGQREIGYYLFEQIFSGMAPEKMAALLEHAEVVLNIHSTDAHILSLPWILLADSEGFLFQRGWSFIHRPAQDRESVELPPSPRVLIIAPEPVSKKYIPTGALQHFSSLQESFTAMDNRLVENDHLRRVRTWAEFLHTIGEFIPNVIYYYGHGEGNASKTCLVFESDATPATADLRPLVDFAAQIKQLPNIPHLVYINCCHGDASGLLGVGQLLGARIPAVISNRTLVKIDVAQKQAQQILSRILFHAIPPHRAINRALQAMHGKDLSYDDSRWINLVLHGNYEKWVANPAKPADRLIQDSRWSFKIDRSRQFYFVAGQTRQMLREEKPRSHAFIWYGTRGQGLDKFHERLNIELKEDVESANIVEFNPRWPDLDPGGVNYNDLFTSMLVDAFKVADLSQIPGRIREKTQGAAGKQALVYLRHTPIDDPSRFNPVDLRTYLLWWDLHIVKPLFQNKIYGLLGISFEVKEPGRFLDYLVKEEIDNLDGMAETKVNILDQLDKLREKDLKDFFDTHRVAVPPDRIRKLCSEIIQETGGNYDETLKTILKKVNQTWDRKERPASGKRTFNY